MKLLIDIGNSTIVIALADAEGNISKTWRIKTMKNETLSFFRHELRVGLQSFGFLRNGSEPLAFDSVVISSVVPEINDKLSQAIYDTTGLTPHFFSVDDARKVIGINIESPSQLGKDRLADAIGARCYYGAPAIVIDMGTATTIGVINPDGNFVGGMIAPGVKTSLKALTEKASQLPAITIEKPRSIIGGNTVECMQSGIVYGTAAMIDGIIDRLLPDLYKTDTQTAATGGTASDTKIIATGGMAKQIVPFCHHNIIIDEYLQFKGLFRSTDY